MTNDELNHTFAGFGMRVFMRHSSFVIHHFVLTIVDAGIRYEECRYY